VAAPGEHAPLQEVFDDFRAELGEMGAEDEDLETHYNLGIAFREMGLLEEAISEFQKSRKPMIAAKYSVTPCSAVLYWDWHSWKRDSLYRRHLV